MIVNILYANKTKNPTEWNHTFDENHDIDTNNLSHLNELVLLGVVCLLPSPLFSLVLFSFYYFFLFRNVFGHRRKQRNDKYRLFYFKKLACVSKKHSKTIARSS